MIYWERVNPVLRIDVLPFMAEELFGDQWIDGRSALTWSMGMTPKEAADRIRAAMEEGYDYLILYGHLGKNVHTCCLRAEQIPNEFGQQPPEWWVKEGTLEALLHEVKQQRELAMAMNLKRQSIVKPNVPPMPGYCKCGLPDRVHVEHSPPFRGIDDDEYKAWVQEFNRTYGSALQRMTTVELLCMPILHMGHVRRLCLIQLEIELRLKLTPTIQRTSSWQLLLES